MFTGLIQHIGKICEEKNCTHGKIISISVDSRDFAGFDNVKIGDSIAVNGVCTTVISRWDNGFSVNLMQESLKCSNLGCLRCANPVNLELAMKANDRLAGHIVTGHIDSVGKVANIEQDGFSKVFSIETETNYVVKKGSITLNGVSLTVSKVGNGLVEVSLIPHTLENTTFQFLNKGDFLNIEFDILAKYIEKFTVLADNNFQVQKTSKINEKFLAENGF